MTGLLFETTGEHCGELNPAGGNSQQHKLFNAADALEHL